MAYLLLAIDATTATSHMVDYVTNIAPQLKDCKIRLVAVVPNVPSNSQQLATLMGQGKEPELHGDEDQHEELVAAQKLLQGYKQQLTAAGLKETVVTTKIKAECLGVSQDLHDEAEDHGCDTIVVGRRSEALSHLFGSVSSKLVKKAHNLNVWVVG